MMSDHNKKPSVSSLLNRPHFQANDSGAVPPDPAIKTLVQVTLDQLVPYADNPRQTINPKYDEIKESIRHSGLDHAPNITRKHPTDPYTIRDGGNTRLQILKELWEETGDQKFYVLKCMFHPFTDDLDMLVGHMRENEMRGSTLFIERAIAAVRIKEKLEAVDQKSISTNALSKRITEMGWSLDQANLGQMLYAHETLLEVIPEALWSGIGRDTVKKIRKLLDSCRTFWESVAKPDEGNFEVIWKQVFTALDGEGFSVDKTEYELCAAMAAALNSPLMSVTAEVQAISDGRSQGGHRPTHILDEVIPPLPNTKSSPVPRVPPRSIDVAPVELNQAQSEAVHIDLMQTDAPVPHSVVMKSIPDATQATSAPVVPATSNLDELLGYRSYRLSEIPAGTPLLYKDHLLFDTDYLQSLAFNAAVAYATHWGLAAAVSDSSGQPGRHMGFILSRDIPMSEGQLFHWVLLHSYANLLNPARHKLLIEDLNHLFGGQLDTYFLVETLTSLTVMRTTAMAEVIRDNELYEPFWNNLCELEAIGGVLLTRTMDESAKVDGEANPMFAKTVRVTGKQGGV